MVLVQDGRIHLSDSVTNYLEDVPDSWKAITVSHLLTHTSGIVKDSQAFDPFKAQPDIEVIRSVYDVPLQFAPGDSWSYSNIGYYVLAEIIHRVTHRPWPEFIEEKVFAAAGISGEHTADPAAIIPNRASGYGTRAGKFRNAEVWQAVRPSGGFLASALDLALWDAALNNDSILNVSNREQMWTPVKLNNQTTHGYGFGWFVETFNGHLRVHHDGGVPGLSCDYERFPESHLSVAVLTNIGQRDVRDLAVGVAAMIIPDLIPPFETPIQDNEPMVTERVRGVVDELAMGRLNEKEFTSELAGWLAGDLKNGFGEDLHGLGPIQKFVLGARELKDKDITYSYRLEYHYVILTVGCTIGEDGRIKRFSIQN
jgi:CubicO group peptidase (beta-lactamase class C family)